MSGDDALKKLLPHFCKKPARAIILIEKLVRESVATLSGEFILYMLNELHSSFHKLEDVSEAKAVVSTLDYNCRHIPCTKVKPERLLR